MPIHHEHDPKDRPMHMRSSLFETGTKDEKTLLGLGASPDSISLYREGLHGNPSLDQHAIDLALSEISKKTGKSTHEIMGAIESGRSQ